MKIIKHTANIFGKIIPWTMGLFVTISTPSLAGQINSASQLNDPTVKIDFDSNYAGPASGMLISATPADPTNTFGYVYSDPFFTSNPSSLQFVSGFAYAIRPGAAPQEIDLIFTSPIAEVGFGLWDANFPGTGVEFFDDQNNSLSGFIQAQQFLTGGAFADYIGWSTGINNISRIHITAVVYDPGWGYGPQGDFIGIDNFSFSQAAAVPEPSSLLMLSAGAVGLLLRRKVRVNLD